MYALREWEYIFPINEPKRNRDARGHLAVGQFPFKSSNIQADFPAYRQHFFQLNSIFWVPIWLRVT